MLMSSAEIFGNSNFQQFAQSRQSRHFFMGLFGYIGVVFFLIKSFGHGNMLWVTSMWEGMIIIMSASYAYFYLGERFSHPVQYLGILLGLLAMFCVHYGEQLR